MELLPQRRGQPGRVDRALGCGVYSLQGLGIDQQTELPASEVQVMRGLPESQLPDHPVRSA